MNEGKTAVQTMSLSSFLKRGVEEGGLQPPPYSPLLLGEGVGERSAHARFAKERERERDQTGVLTHEEDLVN